ncbi:MAG: hypothetical protein JRG73_09510 [Deltaproteobacteria bacterium]|nr:hypothetical protein [Deltaproteobacteria bacterium]
MRVGATFILGLPTETREERLANYWLARELRIDFARFNNASTYPGTKLYEIAKEENGLNVGDHWENLNPISALVESSAPLPYVPTTCTEEELKKDIVRANYRFWLRPKGIYLLLFEGNPSWFSLPPGWYRNPVEWYHVFILSVRIAFNTLKQLFQYGYRLAFAPAKR